MSSQGIAPNGNPWSGLSITNNKLLLMRPYSGDTTEKSYDIIHLMVLNQEFVGNSTLPRNQEQRWESAADRMPIPAQQWKSHPHRQEHHP